MNKTGRLNSVFDKREVKSVSPINKFNSQQSGKCQNNGCDRPIYKQFMCKHHFSNLIKVTLQKELRNIFRGPEKAYSSMDFYGRGYITEEDFLNCIVMTRIPFTKEEVKEMFKQINIFASNQVSKVELEKDKKTIGDNQGMNFDQFKKNFFPKLYLINEKEDSDDDRIAKQNKQDLSKNKDKQMEIITDRLKRLEKILKDKFQNNWESVRKAFLALDSDYDGYITVEDILRHFGQEKGVNYNDLKKLVIDKDSKKVGKIGYTDFSKWVGNTIHQSEGFYFRHDSIKNPQFEQNLAKNEQSRLNMSKTKAQESLINQNLEKTVLDKIKFQWKTLRKAFMDLNMEKSGQILPEELKFYFQHWGLKLNDEQFQYLFDKFDMDKDGKISYKDFQLTVGSEIHPAEGLYFRQDKPQMVKIDSCKHHQCWQPIQGLNKYCQLHQKLQQDLCLKVIEKIFKQTHTKWYKLIKNIKEVADPDDQNQIFVDQFMNIMKKFKVEITEKELTQLIDAFPGRDEGTKKRLNISRIYDQKFNMKLQQLYHKVDVHENDGEDDPVDQSGYTGQFYRPLNKQLVPITEAQLVEIIYKNNKLAEVIRTIKEIDKQHNGFVTTTELDDILKLNYKVELENKDLRQIMKKYASIQNRVLVDYKKFRDSLISQLKQLGLSYTYASEQSLTPQKSVAPQKEQSQSKKGKVVYDALNQFLAARLEAKNDKSPSIKQTITLKEKIESRQNSIVQSSRNGDNVIPLKSLIRPKTRDALYHTSGQKGQQLKSDLNQTLNFQSYKLLNEDNNIGSRTQSRNESARKLGLKKNSTIDYSHRKKLLPENDYEDAIHSYADVNLTTDITDLKRAQSSHGHVGMIQRSQTINGNGIINLLQKRKRRNLLTSQGGSNFRNLSLNNSKAYIDIQENFNSNQDNFKGLNDRYFTTNNASKGIIQVALKDTLNNSHSSVNQQQQMYQTMSTYSNSQLQSLKFKQIIKGKLQYEWKNIYRLLSALDKQQLGVVSINDFYSAIHQCGTFLSKEELQRIQSNYKTDDQSNHINYQRMSNELGLNLGSFSFLKTQQQVRQQNIQKLRNLYSSSEKKKPFLNTTISVTSNKNSLNQSIATNNAPEHSRSEIKEILMKKIKQFKDLINIYQKKNHFDSSIIPLAEFKSVLKGIGVNLSSQSLQKFLVSQPKEDDRKSEQRSRSQSFYNGSGVAGLGIDAKQFLRFYI